MGDTNSSLADRLDQSHTAVEFEIALVRFGCGRGTDSPHDLESVRRPPDPSAECGGDRGDVEVRTVTESASRPMPIVMPNSPTTRHCDPWTGGTGQESGAVRVWQFGAFYSANFVPLHLGRYF
jgi:hypothetical protein